MNNQETFKRLGLPKNSADIYGLLRHSGPMIPTHICEIAHLHRPSVYRALRSLLKNHFIYSTVRGRRKQYHASDPRLITKAFSQISSKLRDRIAKAIIADDSYKQKEVRFLSGPKGIRDAFDDTISHMKRGEVFYRYTSEKDLDKVNKYLSKSYRLLRDKKKLERMVISNPISGMRKKPRLERFIKFIPSNASLFDQNIIQLVYGSRVSLIDLNTERVLVIENKALADFQKVIFKQLYDKLPLP